jgi:hypothetical protein
MALLSPTASLRKGHGAPACRSPDMGEILFTQKAMAQRIAAEDDRVG